jgi:uncharacterized membrane protein
MAGELGPEATRAAPEPRVGACFGHGLEVFFANLPLLLILGVISAAITTAAAALADSDGAVAWLGLLLAVFVANPLRWGLVNVCLDASRKRRSGAGGIVRVRDRYRDVVVASAFVMIGVIAGTFLLVLPGVIVYLRTRFVPYLVADAGLGAFEAIRESFRLTQGLGGTLLGIWLGGLALSFCGMLLLGLGLVPALIWWDLANASLYHAVGVVPARAGPQDGEPGP